MDSNRDHFSIGFVLDERLTREKSHLLMRTVHAMRKYATVEILKTGMTEEEIVEKTAAAKFDLVFVPWYRHLHWKRLDAHFGRNRINGPTMVGYFGDQVLPYEMGDSNDAIRATFVDFTNIKPHETLALVHSILDPARRSGLAPLVASTSPIYYENWYAGQGMGYRIDVIQSLDLLTKFDWKSKCPSIRALLSGLWGIIYEEGPGRVDYVSGLETKTPRAYFQLSADDLMLVMRLCYTRKGWSYRDAVEQFWPATATPGTAAHALLTNADFLRVHPTGDSGLVEITVGLLKSAPALNARQELHTIWIEPLDPKLITEEPYQIKDHYHRQLEPLPEVPLPPSRVHMLEAYLKTKDRQHLESLKRIQELKNLVREKDELITELRRGGVGVTTKMEPPDIESLLDSLQLKYLEARREINDLENEINEAQTHSASKAVLDNLEQRLAAMTLEEQGWITKITRLLAIYRENAIERKKQAS